MTSSPSVSVIIPAYNCARFLGEAVDSALAQTCLPKEIIIIDDGSRDETRNIASRYAGRYPKIVQVYRTVNKGPSAARNLGMKMAGGEYIAFLDSDDVWLPRKTELQLAALAKDPRAGFSYCDAAFVDENRSPIEGYRRTVRLMSGWITPELFGDFFLITSSVIMTRGCAGSDGGFKEDMMVGEDYEYFLRIAGRWPAVAVPERLFERRIVSGSLSRQDALNDFSTDAKTLEMFAKRHPLFVRKHGRQVRARLSACHLAVAFEYIRHGMKMPAFRRIMSSLRRRPSAKAFKYMLFCLVPYETMVKAKRRIFGRKKFLSSGRKYESTDEPMN